MYKYLVSFVELCKLLHLVLLQSSGDLLHSVSEDVDDLMEELEHGLRDDLQDLRSETWKSVWNLAHSGVRIIKLRSE